MHIHIFRFCPINAFEINLISKELVGQNLNIWIYTPPIIALDPSLLLLLVDLAGCTFFSLCVAYSTLYNLKKTFFSRMKEHNRKTFVLTNSDYLYTEVICRFICNNKLSYVICILFVKTYSLLFVEGYYRRRSFFQLLSFVLFWKSS